MKAYGKYFGFALGVVAAVALVVLAQALNWLPVKEVHFIAPNKIQTSEMKKIETTLDKIASVYQGKSLLNVDIKKFSKQLEEEKKVKKANVFRRFPDKLKVEVILHEPVAVLLSKNNKFFPVSRSSELMNEVSVKDLPDLPILRGQLIENSEKDRQGAVELIAGLPEKGRFSVKNISEIYKSKKNGYVAVLKATGTEVLIGNDDFLKKTRQVNRVLKYMDDERLKGRVLDARFNNKVVVKIY